MARAAPPPHGQLTRAVYERVAEGQHGAALAVLASLEAPATSIPRLSLQAYCLYCSGDFEAAGTAYERLAELCPGEPSLVYHFVLCLHKAGLTDEALRAGRRLDPQQADARLLLVAIHTQAASFPAARQLLADLPPSPAALTAEAALAYAEGDHREAAGLYEQALAGAGQGDSLPLLYAAALCRYHLGEYGPALRYLTEGIRKGVREHPELGVGAATEGLAGRSVGNSAALRESHLVEAFNLKAAVELRLEDEVAAREALTDMPFREEDELDPVTLHNTALVEAAFPATASAAARKLGHLLGHPPAPPPTLPNLLLLLCQPGLGRLEQAADLLAENRHLVGADIPEALAEYLEALLLAQSLPEEAYARLEALLTRRLEQLRRLTQAIQVERLREGEDEDGGSQGRLAAAVAACERAVQDFIPVLMAQTAVHWGRGDHRGAQRQLLQVAEFCGGHPAWRLNLAHALFLQEGKLAEATQTYELILRDAAQHYAHLREQHGLGPSPAPGLEAESPLGDEGEDPGGAAQGPEGQSADGGDEGEGADQGPRPGTAQQSGGGAPDAPPGDPLGVPPEALLHVPAVALANLCAAYVLAGRNEEAQGLMAATEAAEAAALAEGLEPPTHMCLINLVVGTLYCSKGNHEFGIPRVLQDLSPCVERLDAQTWPCAKAALLALATDAAQQRTSLKGSVVRAVLAFLAEAETVSRGVLNGEGEVEADPLGDPAARALRATISAEARLIKLAFIKLLQA